MELKTFTASRECGSQTQLTVESRMVNYLRIKKSLQMNYLKCSYLTSQGSDHTFSRVKGGIRSGGRFTCFDLLIKKLSAAHGHQIPITFLDIESAYFSVTRGKRWHCCNRRRSTDIMLALFDHDYSW